MDKTYDMFIKKIITDLVNRGKSEKVPFSRIIRKKNETKNANFCLRQKFLHEILKMRVEKLFRASIQKTYFDDLFIFLFV